MTTDTDTLDLPTIDDKIAALNAERAPFVAALGRAQALQQPAIVDDSATATAAVERRSAVSSWLLGIGKRGDVDKADATARAAAAKADEQRRVAAREQELGRLGEEELRGRLAPLDAAISDLMRERAAVIAARVRVEAEHAATAYRSALIAAGRAMARARALAEIAIERGAAGPRWAQRKGEVIASAPFDGSPEFASPVGTIGVYVGTGLVAHHGGEVVIDQVQMRREVENELRAKGLL